jgi:hypothetical protein
MIRDLGAPWLCPLILACRQIIISFPLQAISLRDRADRLDVAALDESGLREIL